MRRVKRRISIMKGNLRENSTSLSHLFFSHIILDTVGLDLLTLSSLRVYENVLVELFLIFIRRVVLSECCECNAIYILSIRASVCVSMSVCVQSHRSTSLFYSESFEASGNA